MIDENALPACERDIRPPIKGTVKVDNCFYPAIRESHGFITYRIRPFGPRVASRSVAASFVPDEFNLIE